MRVTRGSNADDRFLGQGFCSETRLVYLGRWATPCSRSMIARAIGEAARRREPRTGSTYLLSPLEPSPASISERTS